MTNEEQLELAELKAQSKLKPKEKARLKILERKANKLEQEEKTEKESKSPNRSVFAVQPTTEIPPTPVRYTEAERTVLRTLADDVKAVSQEQVKAVLGKISEINETKLIRASVLLLRKHSDAEVIDAIVAVKRSDLERKMANTNVFGLLKKEEEKKHYKSVRFSSVEKAGLKTRADDIVMNSFNLIVEKLSGPDDVNSTKLIRAAAHLLNNHSHDDIIKAVDSVRSEMFSAS